MPPGPSTASEPRRRGAEVADLLIAATALVHGAEVLHYDSDYDLLVDAEPRLRARWIVPRGSVP